MHILLIDDSSSTRSLLRTLINSGQTVRHEISEAASGEEALQKVASGEISLPDLIIMDINMGGMSGYELCREFRQRHGSISDLRPYIIIVTANEGTEVINQVLDAGANDYMAKPVNVKVLQVRLRVAQRLLGQAQAQGQGGGPSEPADPRQALIAGAIEETEAPVAVVEVDGDEPTFNIVYGNAALSSTTQFDQEQLLGKSLAELEAWTPEFLKMVLGYVGRSAILSYAPLWSNTRQGFQIYLSFYPVHSGEQPVRHYLVIHHL